MNQIAMMPDFFRSRLFQATGWVIGIILAGGVVTTGVVSWGEKIHPPCLIDVAAPCSIGEWVAPDLDPAVEGKDPGFVDITRTTSPATADIVRPRPPKKTP
jgi:hypothetical protein